MSPWWGVAFLVFVAWFWWRGRREAATLTVTALDLAFPSLPPAFDGWRLFHLSDLHLYGPSRMVDRVLAAVEQAHPDAIIITGDLISARRALAPAQELLRALAVDRPTWVVLGNADHRVHPDDGPVAEYRATGAHVLVNASATVTRGDDEIRLVGVDDAHDHYDDLERALTGVAAHEFTMLLSHSPEILDQPGVARVDLILAGHTHGGQIRLPLVGVFYAHSRLGTKYLEGLHRLGRATVFITRGVGTTRLGLRYHCPPEVAVITLRRGG
jgi:predicted MPP superfamily phosphohydrolase